MTSIRQMTYQPVSGRWEPVETMSFHRLRELSKGHSQRGDFHVIAVVTSGTGTLSVDFDVYPLMQRSVVWIMPGAVHKWTDIATVQGYVVLFASTAPMTEATRELAAARDVVAQWVAKPEDWPFIVTAVEHLTLETKASSGAETTEIPSILLSALIARLHPPRAFSSSRNAIFGPFQESVEKHFHRHHDVAFYAGLLGYSPRTLTRACQQETGQTAKRLITERLFLESQRLLAHDQLTVTQCSSALGFIDPSAFSEFFVRSSGLRPGVWQQRWRDLS